MMAFKRLILLPFLLRAGVDGVEERGMNPRLARDCKNSWRRVPISRRAVADRKFYAEALGEGMRTSLIGTYIFAKPPHLVLGCAFGT